MNLILSPGYLLILGFLLIVGTSEPVNGRRHRRDDRKSISVDEGRDAVIACVTSGHFYESEFEMGTRWTKDNRELITVESPRYFTAPNKSLIIRKVTFLDEGVYQCFNGESGGRLMHLKVKEKLKFVDFQSDKKLELNSKSKLHCKTRGHLRQTVTWIKNGADPLPDHIRQEKGILIFNGVQPTDSGRYTCIANDSMATINSTVTVEVVKFPKLTQTPPKTLESEVGSFVILHCAAEGDPTPIINWDKNNVRITNDTADQRFSTFPNGSLLIQNFQLSDEGKYGCIAGSPAGLVRAEVSLNVGSSAAKSPIFLEGEAEDERKMSNTILITASVVILYLVCAASLIGWCRYRRIRRKAAAMANQNGNKPETGDLEMKERKALTSQ